MKWSRAFGIVDLGILTVVAVALLLPARRMYASSALAGTEQEQFAMALAEARTIARPDDGTMVSELSRRLGEAGFKDWAIEAAITGSERAKQSPTRWRALIAASGAYVDRLDVVPALDYANRALAACEAARDAGHGTCPSWEEIRMRLYHQHLDAGVKSGIDPRLDPQGFRKAGEGALRQIRLRTGDTERGPDPTPTK
ncbi:MAG: hypothetical protein M3680_19530 [Myxococcota bacterium]|nr:hypothetical protein [Myxococcota bacterium]